MSKKPFESVSKLKKTGNGNNIYFLQVNYLLINYLL